MPKKLFGRTIMGTVGVMGAGIPTAPSFTQSLCGILQYNYEHLLARDERIRYIWPNCSLHSAARNYLADRALGEWIVMLDSDMIHQADCIARLVHCAVAYGADVVSGVYYKVQDPHFPVLYAWDDETDLFKEAITPPKKMIDDEGNEIGPLVKPFPIDASGGGILLIRSDLFMRIRRELGTAPFDIEQGIGEGRSPFGEDLSFYLKCRRLDPMPRMLCHPGVVSYHLKEDQVTPETHMKAMSRLTLLEQGTEENAKSVIVMQGGVPISEDAKLMKVEGPL